MSGAGLTAADLVGTWRLRSWVAAAADGSTIEPFGPTPLGYVVYTDDGHMITTISEPDRDADDAGLPSGSAAAASLVTSTFAAYSGAFQVNGDDVIHSVEMSLLPDWIGTEQRRHIELSDDGRTLTLSTDPMVAGELRFVHSLSWHRIDA